MTRRRAGYRHIRPRWWQALLVSCTGECGAHRRGRIDELYRTLPGQCLGGLGGSGPHALEVARELLDAPGHRGPPRAAPASPAPACLTRATIARSVSLLRASPSATSHSFSSVSL